MFKTESLEVTFVIRANLMIGTQIKTMFLFINLIHLRPCRVDLLVTCLPLQSTMIGDTPGDFVSFFSNNFIELDSSYSL